MENLVKSFHAGLNEKKIKSIEEWIGWHLEHDDIKHCYGNYIKEYEKLEYNAMRYLKFLENSEEFE